MKNRMTQFASLPALSASAALFLSATATADVIIEWVPIGDPGNAADTTGHGAVDYKYQIGKYEVTNAQYVEFLNKVDAKGVNPNGIYNMRKPKNAGIDYNPDAPEGKKYIVLADMGNKPVCLVSWYDAARFANWMHNGQGTGDTETGAYTLTGNTGLPSRNPDAKVWLPTEDEWYKAAYYDPSPNGPSGADNYWLYPTRNDQVPTEATATTTNDVGNPGTNVANYNSGALYRGGRDGDVFALRGSVTTVGGAGAESASYYGTFDQAGNVWEWNEAIMKGALAKPPRPFDLRGMRGGSWIEYGPDKGADLRSSCEFPYSKADFEMDNIGFRLARASVPENLQDSGGGQSGNPDDKVPGMRTPSRGPGGRL